MTPRIARLLTWSVMALWLAAAVLLAPLAGKTGEVTSTDPAELLPQSAEATQALKREQAAFPGADTPVAVVVYAREDGITAGDRAAVAADRVAFAALSADHRVDPPVPAADGEALLLSFPVAEHGDEPEAVVSRIKEQLADAPPGLDTAVTGSAGALADLAEAASGVDTTLLLAAAGVVTVLLLITYRSPVLWLVPLVSVVLASRRGAAGAAGRGQPVGRSGSQAAYLSAAGAASGAAAATRPPYVGGDATA